MSTPALPANARIVRLEGPGMNALGSSMMARVSRDLADGGGVPILLTGVGKAFSAGLDLKEIAGLDNAGMARFLRGLTDLTQTLFHYPGPTVAAVNGHAIAGGAILALCCDHRVGTREPRARIGLNEVALGLRIPPRVLAMVRHRLPPSSHEPVLLGGALHAPDQALALGLLDALSDDPVATVADALTRLAGHPPAAYAAMKHDLRGAVTDVGPDADRAFIEDVLPVWTSDALKARIRAVLGG